MSKPVKEKNSLENLLAQVDKKIAALERGEVPLAEALKTYDTAIGQLQAAKKMVNAAEAHLKILATVAAAGENEEIKLTDWQSE